LHRDTNPETEVHNMDKLKALCAKHSIALDEGADEDAVLAKLDEALAQGAAKKTEAEAATERATTAEHRLAEIAAQALATEAEQFVVQHKATIKDAAAVKAQYLKDPAGTKAIFANINPAADPKPAMVLHRAGASAPGQVGGAVTEDQQSVQHRSAERRELVAKLKAQHRCSHDRAWEMARNQRPELFKEDSTQKS
jgi:hypothetical protein